MVLTVPRPVAEWVGARPEEWDDLGKRLIPILSQKTKVL
jgi:hypothetical protein